MHVSSERVAFCRVTETTRSKLCLPTAWLCLSSTVGSFAHLMSFSRSFERRFLLDSMPITLPLSSLSPLELPFSPSFFSFLFSFFFLFVCRFGLDFGPLGVQAFSTARPGQGGLCPP
jgi:hypothetical protein